MPKQGQVYAWGHNRVAQLGIGNSYSVPRNIEGAHFLPNPQLVESLLGMVRGEVFIVKRNMQGMGEGRGGGGGTYE